MALKVGDLYAALSLEKTKFIQGLSSSEKSLKGFATRGKATLADFGAAFLKWGTVAAGGLLAVAGLVTKQANDSQKAENQIDAIFGNLSKRVKAWAQTTADSFGVSDDEAMNAAATLGLLFKNFGFGQQAAAGMAEKLVEVASDLASFKNIGYDQAAQAIQRGIAGQTKGLKSLGIVIDETSIKQFALKNKLWDGKGTMDAQTAAAARYGLILDRTKVAAGDFAKRQDSLGNQQRRFAADLNEAEDSLGKLFLPLITKVFPKVIDGLNAVRSYVEEHTPEIQAAIGGVFDQLFQAATFLQKTVVPIVLTGVQAIVRVFTEFGPVPRIILGIAAAFVALNMVMAANPIVAAIMAIIVAVGLLVTAWDQNWGGIRDTVTQVIGELQPQLSMLGDVVGNVVGFVMGLSRAFWAFVVSVAQNKPFMDGLRSILGTIADAFATVIKVVVDLISWFVTLIQNVIDFGNQSGLFAAVGDAISQAFNIAADAIGAVIGAIQAAISVAEQAINIIGSIPGVKLLTDAAGNVTGALVTAGTGPRVGRAPPGTSRSAPTPTPGNQLPPAITQPWYDPTKPVAGAKPVPPKITIPDFGTYHGTAGGASQAANEAKQLAATLKGALTEAYAKVKDSAHKYFDSIHAANLKAIQDAHDTANALLDAQMAANNQKVSDAQKALDAQRKQHELEQLQAAVANATDEQSRKDAQYALDDFLAQQKVDELQAQADTDNAKLEAQKKANDDKLEAQKKAEDDRYNAQVKAFDNELALLEKHLANGTEKYKNANKDILKLLQKYGVDYKTAGSDLGAEFVKGIESQIAAAKAAAGKLAALAGSKGSGLPSQSTGGGGPAPKPHATGAWNIPAIEHALLHPGEMVLPASVAGRVRDDIGRAPSGTSLNFGDVNFHTQHLGASEAEARSFARQMWRYLEEEAYRRGRTLQPVRGGS